uniref:NAD-dependent epimerase/dehydratase domain-containing protein n=1 Tax=Aplanochytrium stocchinoi TaxID=215587 RepID=A0A7S3LI18_9STRA|mmetsp:Transcript_14363/g.17740  ORF Transcript_14363/g.17740 Transcript_14363/m.17740 type:complete len:222 (-) Transcript_14363:709-1374(-)
MKGLLKASVILPVILALALYEWMHIKPRVDWLPSNNTNFPPCPEGKTPFLVFGGTSMLGKYIVDSFKTETKLCLINYGRSKCKRCDLNIKGDLRDSRHVERMVKAYKPETILTSVKPPLLGIHYKTFIELNMLSMIELIKIAKKQGVSNFIYVSSIAASGHYHWHHGATEEDEQPLYTEYEAPYDISKRVAEDFLLAEHEQAKFNVISIRTGGIIGGEGTV